MASVERRSGPRGDVYVVRYRDERKRQRAKTFKVKQEALLFSNTTEVQLKTGDWIDPNAGREKFSVFHARWVEARLVSPSRADTEASHAKNHIMPTWGSVALSAIRPLDVDSWIKNLTAGAATKVEVLAQFKQVLDAAVREQLIRTNPATGTKTPARAKKRVTQADVLHADELDRLVSYMPDRYKALVYLSGWLGWRWSEAMGLRNCDVDLDAGIIYVGNQTVVESRGVQYVHEGGKTDAATRTVPLPDTARDVLRWHLDARFSGAGVNGRVFVTEEGNTPFRSNFRRVFLKAVKAADLEGRGINMRQLRHTAASLMLANGLDILDVQDRLGHTRGSITLDIYGRVLAGRRVAGTDLLGAAMAENSDTTFTHTARFPINADSDAIGAESVKDAV